MKKEKGITLIAIAATVGLMMILAGVAISSITGEDKDSMLSLSNQSLALYQNSVDRENQGMRNAVNELYVPKSPSESKKRRK